MSKRRGASNAAPEVEPLDVDGVRTVAVLTVAWAAALIVLAFFREQLVEEGYGWWLWACLAGVGFGLMALEYARKRRDAILDAKHRAAAAADDEDADEIEDDTADQVVHPEDHKVTGPIEASFPHTGEQPTGPIAAGFPHTGEQPTGPIAAEAGTATMPAWTDHGALNHGVPVRADASPADVPLGDTGHGDTETDTDHGKAARRGGRRKSRRSKERGKRHDHPSPVEAPPQNTPTATSPGGWYVDPTPDDGVAPVEPAPTMDGAQPAADPEFDTDVRAWLNLSDDDVPDPGLSATNTDTGGIRPVPDGSSRSSRPPVGRAGGIPGPTPHPAPSEPSAPAMGRPATPPVRDRSDSGELPPSTPRSAPYPGDARPRPAAATPPAAPVAPARPAPVRPAPARAAHDVSAQGSPAQDPPAQDRRESGLPPSLPRRDRSAGSVDSEFFEPIRPSTGAASGSVDPDDDTPLLETTLGGGRRRRQPAQESERAATEDTYRGRRARRSDSA